MYVACRTADAILDTFIMTRLSPVDRVEYVTLTFGPCFDSGGYAKEMALELNVMFDSVWCPLPTWVHIVLVISVSSMPPLHIMASCQLRSPTLADHNCSQTFRHTAHCRGSKKVKNNRVACL